VDPYQPLITVRDAESQATRPDKHSIFDALDYNGSGSLEKAELVDVLVSWGVSQLEAESIFDSLDVQAAEEEDRKVTREEFEEEWEPIWRYQVQKIQGAILKYKRFSANETRRERIAKETIAQQTTSRNLNRSKTNLTVGEESDKGGQQPQAGSVLAFKIADQQALEAHNVV
jgi:hypothetical protein